MPKLQHFDRGRSDQRQRAHTEWLEAWVHEQREEDPRKDIENAARVICDAVHDRASRKKRAGTEEEGCGDARTEAFPVGTYRDPRCEEFGHRRPTDLALSCVAQAADRR